MLQTHFIRENKAQVIAALNKRNIDADTLINKALELDDLRRQKKTNLDNLLAEANKLAKQIGELYKSGKKADAETLKEQSIEIKSESQKYKDEIAEVETDLQNLLYQIPNVPHASVPVGKGEQDNEVVEMHDKPSVLPQNALPHWELAKKYQLIDFDLGAKITGAGFPVYMGKGAKLQRALISFFLDEALAAGYEEIMPPLMVNAASGFATGQLPDKEGQMYEVTADKFYLIPTAEVPITNLYRDVILSESDFPVKNVGYTPCFRREAGSYGKDVRGLNRLHQFDKVEIVQIQHPEKSYETLEHMVMHVKGLLEKLELHYRVLRLCSGDLTFTSALTFDMEVYAAAQKKWLEVSSISNFEIYQANRLKLRFKNKEGKTQLAHTLNGSALALPRILASLLENNQTENGIKIPDVLVKYTGFDEIV